jgi:dynein heavy chain
MRICGNDLPSVYDLTSDNTSQAILLHSRIVFTSKIEDAILNKGLKTVAEEFETYSTKLQKHKSDNQEERLIIENLLIEISDQLKTIETLISVKCRSLYNYIWVSQLRYYWNDDDVYIRVYNLNILYGYEYMSIQPPFIMTPIIKKVHRELMTFNSQGYSGILKGPAATGKSESIKELARILGNFFVVFNCSPQVDRKQLEELICGTVLSGSTLCLDEFNRLSEENMAWFASHLLGIYKAQLLGEKKRVFILIINLGNARYRIGNLQLPVSSTAAFYLTINPKFLARSSLPANIYSVIRVISMDVADIQSIARAYLLLAGFKHPNKATNLIVNIFDQCQSLLSPMHHYHFQLRTAIATVNEAVSLRAKNANAEENDIIGRSIRHVISPYIVNSDRNAFERLVTSTIHPSKAVNYDEITKKIIRQTIQEMNFIANDKFVDACFNVTIFYRYFNKPYFSCSIFLDNVKLLFYLDARCRQRARL